MIRKLLPVVLMLIFVSGVQAQSNEQEAINKDVWFNFMQAYQDLDASLFNQIHSNDVLRVMVDNDEILIGQDYKDVNLELFNGWNATNLKQKIEFSFTSRVQQKDWAYEVGIFKLTRFNNGIPRSFYGKFHVTLKKEFGTWKIFIDSDTNEKGTIGQEHFEKGTKLQF